jgi:hypothetical protein
MYRLNNAISLFCGLCIITLFNCYAATAQTLPTGFSRIRVVSGINNPTAMAFSPDGRIFVTEQAGKLRVIKANVLLETPALALSVSSTGERGLTGIILDPDFINNRYIYLYYCLPNGSNNRISRFTITGDIVDPASEMVILNLDLLGSATIHNSGCMRFYNGKLFVAVGENSVGANAQNLDKNLGKLLRINPDGTIPDGNPFTSGSMQRRSIWAYGLRNPFTFDIQQTTGKIKFSSMTSVLLARKKSMMLRSLGEILDGRLWRVTDRIPIMRIHFLPMLTVLVMALAVLSRAVFFIIRRPLTIRRNTLGNTSSRIFVPIGSTTSILMPTEPLRDDPLEQVLAIIRSA